MVECIYSSGCNLSHCELFGTHEVNTPNLIHGDPIKRGATRCYMTVGDVDMCLPDNIAHLFLTGTNSIFFGEGFHSPVDEYTLIMFFYTEMRAYIFQFLKTTILMYE